MTVPFGLTFGSLWPLVLGAFFVGASQALAPDRWMPLAGHAWQRGWSKAQLLGFSALSCFFHVAVGAVLAMLFWALVRILGWSEIPHFQLGLVVVFIFGVGAWRVLRFSRFALQKQPEQTTGKERLGVFMWVLSFMGPAEALIPLFSKLQFAGAPVFSVLGFFLAGTFAVAGLATLVFYLRMNNPYRRVRSLFDLSRPAPMVPSVFVLALMSAWLLTR